MSGPARRSRNKTERKSDKGAHSKKTRGPGKQSDNSFAKEKIKNRRKKEPNEQLPAEAHPALKSIYEKLNTLKEYKKLLAASGLSPSQEDKEQESNLIIQLKRIEKGLPPKKVPSKKDIKLGRGGRKKKVQK